MHLDVTLRPWSLAASLLLVAAAILAGPFGAAVAAPTEGERTHDGGKHDTGPTADLSDEPGTLGQDPQHTVAYEIETRGRITADPEAFAGDVATILGDARGWTLGGSVGFAEVGGDAELTIALASPDAVDAAHEVCSPEYSCRVGDLVLINDDNWRTATPAWREAGGDLATYREYLINHEVGHYLGFEHADCPAAGDPAPVMQQQSISLQGCEPRGWPLAWERQDLADELGVQVRDWIFPDVVSHHVHRDAIHALAEGDLLRGGDDGRFHPSDSMTRAQLATVLSDQLGLEAQGPPPFDDVAADAVHAEGIAAVAEAGIAEGYGDGSFGPSDLVARGQMAAFLTRAYGFAAADPPFDDVPAHHPHAEEIAAVAEAGVAEGFEDAMFRPGSLVERGQMASFLLRADSAG